MARFYQTASPEYLDNIIYQPPWELMNQALATKQFKHEQALATTEALNGLLQINHLNSEEENENVSNIVNYYESEINDLANKIMMNPGKESDYTREISRLQKEISQDRQTGDIYKIESSYNNYQTWLENMKKSREEDPHRFNAALTSANTQWGGNSITGTTWGQQDIIKDPDFNSYLDTAFKNLIPNTAEVIRETPKGGYIISQEGVIKEITPQEIQAYAINLFNADPQNKAWMKQSQDWGLGRYFDDEGRFDAVNSDGTINQNNSISSFLNAAGLQAYTESKDIQKIESDATWISNQNRAQDWAIHKDDMAYKWAGFYEGQRQFDLNRQDAGEKLRNEDIKGLRDLISSGEYDGDELEAMKLELARLEGRPFFFNFSGKAIDDFSVLSSSSNPQDKLAMDELWAKADIKNKGLYDQYYNKLRDGKITVEQFQQQIDSDLLTRNSFDLANKLTEMPTIYGGGEKNFMKFTRMIEAAAKDPHHPDRKWLLEKLGESKTSGNIIKTLDEDVSKLNLQHSVQMEPLSSSGSYVITQAINSNKGDIYVMDSKGNILDTKGKNINVKFAGGVTEGNTVSLKGTMDGREVFITPKYNTPIQKNINRNLTMDINPSSAIYPSIINENVATLESVFNSKELEGGGRNLTIPDPTGMTSYNVRAFENQNGSRQYQVFYPGYDPNSPLGQASGRFDSVVQLEEFLRINSN